MSVTHIETIVNTNLVFLHQTRIQSQIIYTLTLLAVIITLGALPFIYITISVKSVGLIQTTAERTELFAPVGGRVLYINLTDNQKVIKGSTLLIIDGKVPKQQNNLLSSQIMQLKQQLNDVEELIKKINEPLTTKNYRPQTKLYISSWQNYTEQFQNATNAVQQAKRIYLRYRALYIKDVVTLSEFELHKYDFEQAISNQQALTKKHINQWQIEANQYQNELRVLQSQKTQLNEQIKHYSLTATLNGSLQNLTSLQKDSYVYAYQKLGEISPDNALFAYSYVKPSDIGLLKKGQTVRVQVDAFNYNQWGMLTGRIIDISDDIIMQNQSPYFKIRCKLDRNYLQLKSGYKGYVRKGMTIRANYTVAERSLYQLLYENVENWIKAN